MSFPFVQPYFGLGNSLQTAQGGAGAVGGWVELGRTTLGSSGDTISVGSLSDKRYYMVLCDLQQVTSGIRSATRLNGDTGSNYATRDSENGVADGTATSVSYIKNSGSNTYNGFNVGYLSNLSSKEKLMINHYAGAGNSGAASAPTRHETVGKWTNTSNPISTIAQYNDQAGDFNTGSECVVLGWDPADTHTTNFWEELASADLSGGAADDISSGTFTAKKYLWVQCFMEQDTSSITGNVTFNSDTGSNYSRRRSSNGATDSTGTSESSIDVRGGETKNRFENMFIINNSAQEKLVIGNMVVTTAGVGTAPDRTEYVAKWANTSNQITSINFNNIDPGNYGTKTTIKVWGSD